MNAPSGRKPPLKGGVRAAGAADSSKAIPSAIAGGVLGAQADLPVAWTRGKDAAEKGSSVSRPGSRGQPSARGSPVLEQTDRPMTTAAGRRLPKLDGLEQRLSEDSS